MTALDPADYRGEVPGNVGTKMPVAPVLQGENRKKLLEGLYSEVLQSVASAKNSTRALEHSLSLPHGMKTKSGWAPNEMVFSEGWLLL